MVPSESGDTFYLICRARDGDQAAYRELFQRYRQRLRQMVEFRLDQRLRGRIDPSDVIQEAYVVAARRLGEYVCRPTMPFYLWLRWMTAKKLMELHRYHLGVKARNAGREISWFQSSLPVNSTALLARRLLGREASPSQAAMQAELVMRLQNALNSMSELDREVIVLRHFEQLKNTEMAGVLGIDPSSASSRYLRAIQRLKRILEE